MPSYRSKRIRDPIDVLRVRFWYEGVRSQMGCSTAKRLELHFWSQEDPDFMEKDPPGKWARYKLGKNTPRPSLINKVEKEVAGSAKELDHPLWKVLGFEEKALGNIDEWFKKLDQEVMEIVFRSTRPTPQLLQSFSLTLCRQLVRLGNLDSLTALLLYWHKSRRKDKIDQTQILVRQIYKILLIIGMEFYLRGLAEAFFELFRDKVFEKTNWGNQTFAMDYRHYFQGIRLLTRLVDHTNGLGILNSLEEEQELKYQLLAGKHGLHIPQILGIQLQSNRQEEPPTK
ncbi:hypothetical protein [Methylobacter tundripaludum]|uniref:Uncharacterized protein n=1 Tax=Methylobacter tundripaludum (strain ATCC BAA-1195 / DSM 17260 / SV96) TaxID=697282 RepID=G3IWS7_METTV|nr:hypothetical protein [Methylobacter tundripaludum]EGW23136.1 hypothetical protein Mettu_1976 [Methylobacter tundripaludum SV96]